MNFGQWGHLTCSACGGTRYINSCPTCKGKGYRRTGLFLESVPVQFAMEMVKVKDANVEHVMEKVDTT